MRAVSKTMRRRLAIAGLLGAILAQAGEAAAQTVRAFVEPSQPAAGQTFTLSVEVAGGVPEDPQLPPMEDFAAYLGSGRSQRIELVNGRMSSSVTINYTFQALRAGRFTIGPVSVEIDGKSYKTEPIALEIASAGGGARAVPNPRSRAADQGLPRDALFLRADVSRREVFQNQPVVITYKVYFRVDLNSYGFSKTPAAAGFWVEDYPLGNRPRTDIEVIDGRRYRTALIKKIALYPTSPGRKTVSPLELQCEVTLPRRRDSLFEDFFGSGGIGGLFGETATRFVSSDEVEINVLPLPAEGRPDGFGGAVGRFQVQASLDKNEVSVNDAVTVRVRVSGTGNFPTMGEPRFSLPPSFEVYPPNVEEKIEKGPAGLTGSKTYEYVAIPRLPGEESIGPVELPYFDPESRAYRVARSDVATLRVGGRADVASDSPEAVAKQDIKRLGRDIRFIKTDPGGLRKIGASYWPEWALWLAATLPLAALAAALLYRRRLDRLRGDVAYARDRRARRVAKKRLARARSLMRIETRSEFFAEAGKALTGFLADKLNLSEAGLMTEKVGSLLLEKGVRPETVESYLECLRDCDRERFAPTQAGLERMEGFMARAERAMGKMGGEL